MYNTSTALESVQKTLISQNEAMSVIASQYQNDEYSKDQLLQSLETFFQTSVVHRGKIVLCGIGKSFKIASKLVATLNSLAIQASLLHPLEALHGDLGMLREGDTLVFITALGNTPELLNLLPHISPTIPIVLLTCNKYSKLGSTNEVKSVLYAELPAHLKEDSIHGIPAPTVSTTITLALADATILTLSEMIEQDLLKRRISFSMNHPGGAIGADLSHLNVNLQASAPSATSRDAGRRLSMSKERENPSSQVSTSSLLSLSQVRSGLKQNNGTSMSSTASTSSDDDDSQNHQKQSITPSAAANSPLSLSIQNNPTSVLSVKEQDLITCTKIQLLEWITLYDYIVAEKTNGSKTACESSRIKLIYRMECKNIVDGEWNMRKFTAAFSII